MTTLYSPHPTAFETGRRSVRLRGALLQLAEGGPERLAITAGEIDAVIDYSHSNVILLPAARLALLDRARRISAVKRAFAANNVLAALPRAEYRRLQGDCELVTLRRGDVLHEPGAPILHVYFPVDSVICLLAAVDDKQVVEVGLVGHEGMVGISLAIEAKISSVRALVATPGTALRMEAEYFCRALPQCALLRRVLHRYADIKLTLARKTLGCNCFHLVEARLARWLLMISDRVRSHEFVLTHESLADMLGVRRVSITQSASHLQGGGLIRYARGKIRILDRQGLEGASCKCYSRIESLRETTSVRSLPHLNPLHDALSD
jgi:CRP-like cAMP-binding protein